MNFCVAEYEKFAEVRTEARELFCDSLLNTFKIQGIRFFK